ncbi:adenosine 3'-phospho 5'-phosphosulfate transporter 1 [Copidosoma floridanum]|uniref:adenosine 3'-phospho 5'-phosphosulfate transporter 1 n=1 Tax=Copidosoma floridanum TaxID=29053 RepID=UPI0006C94C40|nr:adenosine 3'-phospho 5'-phosphosulfate transporter 1 [Copidosoma floridanum]
MGNYAGDFIICLIVLFSLCIIYSTTHIIKSFIGSGENIISSQTYYSWIIRFCFNFCGYATVLLPGYLIFKYVRRSKYFQRRGKGCLPRLVHSCFVGSGDQGLLDSSHYSPTPTNSHSQRTFLQDSLLLIHCFLGLQVSYLTWGYLQEKIMTQKYDDGSGNTSHFKDSQFLVFINRVLAVFISAVCLLIIRQPPHTIPLYKYAFCSFSNVLSSWCQYEALKYVSFPTQVLAKASKIIPVMIMGKIVSRAKYEYYEYVTAVLISIGMMMFMLGSTDHKNDGATTFSGVILLGAYMTLDSFTSNWQNALFNDYGVTSLQMMCAVNLFSCLLTATSLFQQSSLWYSLAFITTYPHFILDCILISVFSTTGQLYIFYTISNFGAVTFIIMMTVRQGFAILLSCLLYHHYITPLGILGIFLVFLAVFLRIYCNNRLRSIKKRRAEAISIKNKS